MIIHIKKQEFDFLADEALLNACFKPLILEYKKRMAKQPENSSISKELFYKELTTGQKACLYFMYIMIMQLNQSVSSIGGVPILLPNLKFGQQSKLDYSILGKSPCICS
ncbi:hypothetical protein [Caldalkalibacillus mannanilyticus]|uniref:hypothetical protein n=1 Tax=Caldalkalibacillus mannanilyticus TaxID=1418 RepID=UPI0004688FB5|nr:hypothetical protein [Caldalkalibacillus mannanilyticus]